MLESFNTKSEMQYERLTEEEKSKRGILGRLVGIIADFKNSTRNGRRYTEELWDKTFSDPIVKEKIENRCLFGELGHPADRQEIDMEKIAICLAEMPKKGNDGKLYGVFDILDTPNGRILKTMCDYGCNIGVSSRGGGDTYEDYNGGETVEPDSYELECWDAVLLPAVKAARPAYVTESLNTKRTLKAALFEELNRSTDDEKKIMENTLNQLNIDYSAEEEFSESVDNIDVTNETETADDNGVDVINELQEALKRQQELENKVKSLQEKLSVCYTKETRYSDKLSKVSSKLNETELNNTALSEANSSLTESLNQLNAEVSSLKESVNQMTSENTELKVRLEGYQARFSKLQEQLKEATSSKSQLTEGLSSKSVEVSRLTEEYRAFKESASNRIEEQEENIKSLTSQNSKLLEDVQELKKDSQIMRSQNNAKIEKSQQLVEKYKAIAKTAVNKYIEAQATSIGVSSSDIKSRLNESYSFKDIDKAVSDLQQYKLTINSLPFSTMSEKKPVKMKIRESKEPLLEMLDNSSYKVDDDIDETLLTFTN